jgi:hypothetical protein
MNGGQSAAQARSCAQFLKGQIGLLVDQRPELLLLPGNMTGFAAGAVMLGAHVAEPPPLLQELLDQAQGNPKTGRHRLPSAFASVIRSQNPFAQIQGDRLHPHSLPGGATNGYSFI